MIKRVLFVLVMGCLCGIASGVSPAVAESSAQCTVANLNAAWQQYVATQMCASKKPKLPKDFKEACKILVDAKFIEKIPTPPKGYVFDIKYGKPKAAMNCEFIAKAKVMPSAEKLEKIWRGKVSNLNAAWQKYCALEQSNGREVKVPPNFIIAMSVLEEYDNTIKFDDYFDKDVDWNISWKKSVRPAECKFELQTALELANEMVALGFKTMFSAQQQVKELQGAWDKYRATEIKAGREIAKPQNVKEVLKLLKDNGLIKKDFNTTTQLVYKFYFRPADKNFTGKFGVYFNNRYKSEIDKQIRETELDGEVMVLNGDWQIYVATKRARGEKIGIPADAKVACSSLLAEKLINEIPEYIDRLKFIPAEDASGCKFVLSVKKDVIKK